MFVNVDVSVNMKYFSLIPVLLPFVLAFPDLTIKVEQELVLQTSLGRDLFENFKRTHSKLSFSGSPQGWLFLNSKFDLYNITAVERTNLNIYVDVRLFS